MNKRGRPPTGTALSVNERKRKSRQRNAELCKDVETNINLISTLPLCKALSKAVCTGDIHLVKVIQKELLDRVKNHNALIKAFEHNTKFNNDRLPIKKSKEKKK